MKIPSLEQYEREAVVKAKQQPDVSEITPTSDSSAIAKLSKAAPKPNCHKPSQWKLLGSKG
jgi:hypothetical protein